MLFRHEVYKVAQKKARNLHRNRAWLKVMNVQL